MGPRGCQGPEGESAARLIGFAYGTTTAQTVAIPVQFPLENATTATAPLFNGIVPPRAPFSFTPYVSSTSGGYFTINVPGNYLMQYDLTAVPSVAFATDLSTTASRQGCVWIAVEVMRNGAQMFAGAVPVTVTNYCNTDPDASALSGDPSFLCCFGSGQIALNLQTGDQVSLQIFAATATTNPGTLGDKKLYISSNNITYPTLSQAISAGISRGPTLAIQKIGDSLSCHQCCQ